MMCTRKPQIVTYFDERGGESDLLLGALLRASTEAKQPPKPSHKQSYPPLVEWEIAVADQEDFVDP